MGGLVQQPPSPRADRQYPAGRGGSALLCRPARDCAGGLTQAHQPPANLERFRFPQATELIGDDYSYERLNPTVADSVVIATQHKGDHLSAVRALRSPASYIAIIASRKRASLMCDFLRGEGFTDRELARLRAPAGLDLGAWTPAEIALSILAEIVMLRRGGSGLPRTAANASPQFIQAS
ncbi:XdhC family protein [Paeniroseomonas aquatica]